MNSLYFQEMVSPIELLRRLHHHQTRFIMLGISNLAQCGIFKMQHYSIIISKVFRNKIMMCTRTRSVTSKETAPGVILPFLNFFSSERWWHSLMDYVCWSNLSVNVCALKQSEPRPQSLLVGELGGGYHSDRTSACCHKCLDFTPEDPKTWAAE